MSEHPASTSLLIRRQTSAIAASGVFRFPGIKDGCHPFRFPFQYGYDQDGNVLYQANGVNGTFSQLYSYDSMNRLTGYQQGTLNGADTSITGTPTASQSWTYDALGNQDTVTTNGTATTNTTNSKNELTASGSAAPGYDNDGNTLTDENGQTYTYNAWNQMVSAKNATGTTLATYSYDARGRRITETESGATTDIYYSNQWQDIEERESGVVTQQNVWGLAYLNQLVERDDNSASGSLGITGSGLGERLFAQQGLNWTTTALTNDSGTVVQRFESTPYGVTTVLTPTWSSTTDAYNWTTQFQGGQIDSATGLYEFEQRDYNPYTGVWYENDPEGYIDGTNLYQFETCDPANSIDPTGSDRIVIAFEGISGYPKNLPNPGGSLVGGLLNGVFSDPFVQEYWEPVVQQHAHSIWHYEPEYSQDAIFPDVVKWATTHNPDSRTGKCYDTLTILGFSNGCQAALQLSRQLLSAHIAVNGVFTVDPVGKFLNGPQNWTAPANVALWRNFYETGEWFRFRGTSVNGANVWNTHLTKNNFAEFQIDYPNNNLDWIYANSHTQGLITHQTDVINGLNEFLTNIPLFRQDYKFKP